MSASPAIFLCEPFTKSCGELQPEPCGLIIFGASGDLTRRKLLPALWRLYQRRRLPARFYILGCARSAYTPEEFRLSLQKALPLDSTVNEAEITAFFKHIDYLSGDYSSLVFYEELKEKLKHLDEYHQLKGNHLFYLATPPNLTEDIVSGLGSCGLAAQHTSSLPLRWSRLIVEKPFGTSLSTALALNHILYQHWTEDQLYRIDHYLGKETVQNILVTRFANLFFAPLWNQQYIEHVQITVSEDLGVEKRAGYYEQAGALRDMFQNHMLQLLAMVAMEPPAIFNADRYRDEKVKVLRAIRSLTEEDIASSVIRGQYAASAKAPGYKEEAGVAASSSTETFVALKLYVDNWRWAGVPFYLRSGKRLAARCTEIAITFKEVPHSIFSPLTPQDLTQNTLVFTIQPEEGVHVNLQAKRPGPKLCMSQLKLHVRYQELDHQQDSMDAYERLLLDAICGDQTLFVRNDDIEAAWSVFQPVLDYWQEQPQRFPLHEYACGSQGPAAASSLFSAGHAGWRNIPGGAL